MYSHLHPLHLYGYSGCVHTPLMPIHKNIWGEFRFGAKTCGACIRTRVNTGRYSWRILYVWVSCQGAAILFGPLRSFQGPLNGGVSNGGVSRSGLVLPFLSFFVLSRFFRDFPDLIGDGPGIFPIRPFSLSRPIKSTYEEQSRQGPRHNLDLSRKKWETPGFGNPPVQLLSIFAFSTS